MKLAAKALSTVVSVNSFRYLPRAEVSVGDAFDFYFQLVDLEQNPFQPGTAPDGLRYVALAGSTVQVTVLNIDDAVQFTRVATNPFSADDRSIWKASFLSGDPMRGTISLKIVLTEGGVARTIFAPAMVAASAINDVC